METTDIIASIDPNWRKPPVDDNYIANALVGLASRCLDNPQGFASLIYAGFASLPAAARITWDNDTTANVSVVYATGSTSVFAVVFGNSVSVSLVTP